MYIMIITLSELLSITLSMACLFVFALTLHHLMISFHTDFNEFGIYVLF